MVPYLNLIAEKLNNQTLRRLREKNAGLFVFHQYFVSISKASWVEMVMFLSSQSCLPCSWKQPALTLPSRHCWKGVSENPNFRFCSFLIFVWFSEVIILSPTVQSCMDMCLPCLHSLKDRTSYIFSLEGSASWVNHSPQWLLRTPVLEPLEKGPPHWSEQTL